MRSRSTLRHRAEHLVFRAVSGALGLLPRDSAAAFGSLLGRLFFVFAPSRRRILQENLAAAFPEKDRELRARIERDCVDRVGATFMEFLESTAFSRQEIEERVKVAGAEHLEAARRRGKGVFLLSAHFGSWEMGALRAGMLGQPISSVVRPLDNPLLEEELARRRTRFGNRAIAKRNATKEILRSIRRHETVAILIDQNVLAEEAIFVPFFGRLAATTPSLALLQLKTDAAVVPVFTWPEGSGRYRLEFEPPILASEFESACADRSERVRLATARYTAAAEAAIRRYPAAWLWMHNRWRTRPEE